MYKKLKEQAEMAMRHLLHYSTVVAFNYVCRWSMQKTAKHVSEDSKACCRRLMFDSSERSVVGCQCCGVCQLSWKYGQCHIHRSTRGP